MTDVADFWFIFNGHWYKDFSNVLFTNALTLGVFCAFSLLHYCDMWQAKNKQPSKKKNLNRFAELVNYITAKLQLVGGDSGHGYSMLHLHRNEQIDGLIILSFI